MVSKMTNGIRNAEYKPIFPWFGGKSPVADLVWDAIGSDVANYVEPFFGSGAVLFLRPGGAGHIETVNDADLHARHLWLIGQRERITDRLCGDESFYDAKAAGWWAWGLCCWIGSGWCSGNGPWQSVDGQMVLRNPGQGVNRQLPHLGDPGKGHEPETPDECYRRREWLKGYLYSFASRLRNVRVCCGDWARVCGPSVTFRHGPTGVFLDPPYADSAKRTANLYATDCEQVAHQVREWAIEQGKNPLMRIVLAGYEGEHQMPSDWQTVEWQATGGYGLISGDEEQTGRANRKRERLWLSPACLKHRSQRSLFDAA